MKYGAYTKTVGEMDAQERQRVEEAHRVSEVIVKTLEALNVPPDTALMALGETLVAGATASHNVQEYLGAPDSALADFFDGLKKQFEQQVKREDLKKKVKETLDKLKEDGDHDPACPLHNNELN